MKGEADAERFLRAAHAQASATHSKKAPPEFFPAFNSAACEVARLIKDLSQLEEVGLVAQDLRQIPMPFAYLGVKPVWNPSRRLQHGYSPAPSWKKEEPFVIKVMFDIDGLSWSTPQILRADIIYTLTATVNVSRWPKETDHLVLDYVSTLSPEFFSITPFEITRPDSGKAEYRLSGHVQFSLAQSLLSEPAVIRVRAIFESSPEPKKTNTRYNCGLPSIACEGNRSDPESGRLQGS